MLEQMPLISGVRDTHGTGEVGKDIVFEMADAFYGKSLHACVIKNFPITGSVESDRGARTVLFQAEQALDTPIPRTTNAIPERVQRILVISPYECTVQTMESIRGKLANADRVRFLCGRALWDQFVQHRPSYLLFHAGSLARLAATIVSTLDKDEVVQDALRQHGFAALPHTLRGTYIPPRFAKRFYRFSVSLSLPEIAKLERPLKKVEIDSIARDVISTASFLSELSAQHEGVRDHRSKANAIAAELKKAWNDEFQKEWNSWKERCDKMRVKKRRPPEPLRSLEAMVLPGGGGLLKKATKVLSEFRQSTNSIHTAVNEANKICSTLEPTNYEWLTSPLLSPYSFVENLSCAYPGVIQKERTASSVFTLERNIIEESAHNILIAGPPGTGKTSFCRWQAMEDVDKLKRGESKTVSQYIPMYRLNGRGVSTFEQTFLLDPEIETLWATRHSHSWLFRLYLDGLDELADVTLQQRVLELALDAKHSEKRLSVLVTGRDYISAPALKHFIRMSVEPFDDPQLDEFIRHWFTGDDKAEETFRAQLKDVPSLRELMRVPLLGTLVVKVHQSMRSLPSSRVKLYAMFTELLAGGWDFAKQVNRGSKFGPEPKIAVLSNLADRLHEDRRRDFTEADFRAAVKQMLPFYASRAPELLVEVCRDGLVVPEGQYFGFLHHSFQEYLAATCLTELGGEKARRAVRRFLSGDEWWGEVVKFAIALSRNPQATRRYIEKAALYLKSRIQETIVKSRQKELLDALAVAYPGSAA